MNEYPSTHRVHPAHLRVFVCVCVQPIRRREKEATRDTSLPLTKSWPTSATKPSNTTERGESSLMVGFGCWGTRCHTMSRWYSFMWNDGIRWVPAQLKRLRRHEFLDIWTNVIVNGKNTWQHVSALHWRNYFPSGHRPLYRDWFIRWCICILSMQNNFPTQMKNYFWEVDDWGQKMDPNDYWLLK